MHASDINNPVLPLPLHTKWTDLIADEFYEQVLLFKFFVFLFFQAQTEKENSIPVTLFMADKDPLAKAKSNQHFLEIIVAPLWTALTDLFPELKPCLEVMKRNGVHWRTVIESLTVSEDKTS